MSLRMFAADAVGATQSALVLNVLLGLVVVAVKAAAAPVGQPWLWTR